MLPRRSSGFHKLVINHPKLVIIPLSALHQLCSMFLMVVTICLIPHQLVQFLLSISSWITISGEVKYKTL